MERIFKKAIVRRPSAEMVNGISNANLGKPDFKIALEQHNSYIKSLEMCGLEVIVLPALTAFPDATFIEDVSLCTPECAIVTNPGASSRNGETAKMKTILAADFKAIEEITSPGKLDAGDVMMVGSHYYIGLSERTNDEGASQLIAILEKYGMSGSKVKLKEVLHLKTGLSYLEHNNLLVSGEFIDRPEFKSFKKIEILPEEAYAANSLWINGTVLVPKGFPDTLTKIKEAGYKTIEVDVSEFRKLDGGLSCLSLRF